MTERAPFVVPTAQGLLDAIPASAVLLDRAGIIRAVNRRWLEFCVDEGGHPAAASPSSDYLRVCDANTADGVRAVLAGDLDHFEAEYPCHGPDTERWFRMMVTPVESGALILHVDITGEYARVSRWLESTSSPMIELDPSGGAVFVNQAWADLQRTPRRALLGARWAPRLGDEDRRHLDSAVATAVAEGVDRTVDLTLTADDRGPLCIRFLVSSCYDRYHRLQRILLVGMDVTAARRLNDHLAAGAERERIAAHVHDGIMQDLLAVGLTLQANRTLREAEPELLSGVNDSLDRSIGDLRALGRAPAEREWGAQEGARGPATEIAV